MSKYWVRRRRSITSFGDVPDRAKTEEAAHLTFKGWLKLEVNPSQLALVEVGAVER